MSDYVKVTNFATKDSLPSGDTNKVVRGTEINTEFDNIATAVATKANIASPTFTGTVTIPTVAIAAGTITGITDLAVADGGTGASTASDARTNLGLVIGTDVQAYDAQLSDIAGLTPTDGVFIVGDGTNFVTESGATARASIGVGSISTQAADNVNITGGSITGITDLAVADGGTGASTAAGARAALLPSFSGQAGKVLAVKGDESDVEFTTASAGTVTSVDMTVPTGLSVSGNPVTSSGTLAVTYSAGYAIPTTTKQSNWDDAYTFTGNFPSQTGNSGKYLTTDGSALSWDTVDALPDQTGNSGKYLTTDGSTASWATVNVNPALDDLSDVTITSAANGEVLQYNGSGWVNATVSSGNTTSNGLWENSNEITSNYTITTNYNALSAGPVTVASGVTVTVPTGSRWVVI